MTDWSAHITFFCLFTYCLRGTELSRSLVVELFVVLVHDLGVLVSSPGPWSATLWSCELLLLRAPANSYYSTTPDVGSCIMAEQLVPPQSFLHRQPSSPYRLPQCPWSQWKYHSSGQQTRRYGSRRWRLNSQRGTLRTSGPNLTMLSLRWPPNSPQKSGTLRSRYRPDPYHLPHWIFPSSRHSVCTCSCGLCWTSIPSRLHLLTYVHGSLHPVAWGHFPHQHYHRSSRTSLPVWVDFSFWSTQHPYIWPWQPI